MVHLASVQSDEQIRKESVSEFSDVEFPALDENTITSSVYGSKWAGQELPKHEMPEDEMPKEVAYRMIKVCHAQFQNMHQAELRSRTI
jgi:glutamate decarboxylase